MEPGQLSRSIKSVVLKQAYSNVANIRAFTPVLNPIADVNVVFRGTLARSRGAPVGCKGKYLT